MAATHRHSTPTADRSPLKGPERLRSPEKKEKPTAETSGAGTENQGTVPPSERKPRSFYTLAMSVRAMNVAKNLMKGGGLLQTGPKVEETPKLENTYKLGPDPGQEVKVGRVKQAIDAVLESTLSGQTYEKEACSKLALEISDKIKYRIRELGMPRHKTVCNVFIGQKLRQGVHTASLCLWNPSTDTYVNSSYENDSLFAVALVYGIYYE